MAGKPRTRPTKEMIVQVASKLYLEKLIALDYKSLARRILSDFKDYITTVNFMAVESARLKLLDKVNQTKEESE